MALTRYTHQPDLGDFSPAPAQLEDSFVQMVSERVNIATLVGKYVRLKKAGANLLGLCPFHDERSPSFTVSETKQFYHCFGCGSSGDAIEFLRQHCAMSFREAIEELASISGTPMPGADKPPSSWQAANADLYAFNQRAAGFFQHCLQHTPQVAAYARSRGLNEAAMQAFIIGYAPDEWQGLQEAFPNSYEGKEVLEAGLVKKSDSGRRFDFFRNRLIFGIRDAQGRIQGFGGRTMEGTMDGDGAGEGAALEMAADGGKTPPAQSKQDQVQPAPAPAASATQAPTPLSLSSLFASSQSDNQNTEDGEDDNWGNWDDDDWGDDDDDHAQGGNPTAAAARKPFVAPKYLNTPVSPIFDKSSALFGLYEAKAAIRQAGFALVTEGYMDTVALSVGGIRNTVATMGTAATALHIERLLALSDTIVFAFDGDEAGRKAAFKALRNCLPLFTEKRNFRFLILPDGKDPDDIILQHGRDHFMRLIDNAYSLSGFILQHFTLLHGLDTPEQRARFLQDALDTIAGLPRGSPMYRAMRQEISRAAQQDESSVIHMARASGQGRMLLRKSHQKWDLLQHAIRLFPATATQQSEPMLECLSPQQQDAFFQQDFERLPGAAMWQTLYEVLVQEESAEDNAQALPTTSAGEDALQASLHRSLLEHAAQEIRQLMRRERLAQMRLQAQSGTFGGDAQGIYQAFLAGMSEEGSNECAAGTADNEPPF